MPLDVVSVLGRVRVLLQVRVSYLATKVTCFTMAVQLVCLSTSTLSARLQWCRTIERMACRTKHMRRVRFYFLQNYSILFTCKACLAAVWIANTVRVTHASQDYFILCTRDACFAAVWIANAVRVTHDLQQLVRRNCAHLALLKHA